MKNIIHSEKTPFFNKIILKGILEDMKSRKGK